MGYLVLGSIALLIAFVLFVITVKFLKGTNDVAPLFCFMGCILMIAAAAWFFDNASDFGTGQGSYRPAA